MHLLFRAFLFVLGFFEIPPVLQLLGLTAAKPGSLPFFSRALVDKPEGAEGRAVLAFALAVIGALRLATAVMVEDGAVAPPLAAALVAVHLLEVPLFGKLFQMNRAAMTPAMATECKAILAVVFANPFILMYALA